jgi:hypothetical protein
MKILLLSLTLIPFTLHADPRGEVQNITRFLSSPGVSVIDCGIETKKPNIKKGEVKVAYECADFELPTKKVDQEDITFYLDPVLDKEGLIIRSRVNAKDPTERDVTIKFRPHDQDGPVALEKILYEQLKAKSDEAKRIAKENGTKETLELKCEADVSYGPKFVNSCQLTTTTADLTADHQAFAQMSTGDTVKKTLAEFESVQIKAQSWKLTHADFAKGISAEQWKVKNKGKKELCLLEVSAKFEVEEEPKKDLPDRLKVEAEKAMAKLMAAFPNLKPSEQQGNKTGKALEFARSK